jgi:hypothetical protein
VSGHTIFNKHVLFPSCRLTGFAEVVTISLVGFLAGILAFGCRDNWIKRAQRFFWNMAENSVTIL